MDHTI